MTRNSVKPLSVLIVDDEPLARRRLRRLIEERADIEIAGECRNGLEAVETIRRAAPDLLFLDVQMPDLDGIGVLEQIGLETISAVIFVTAYDRYALQAFDLHAVDYLLKPFTDSRFSRAVDRAIARVKRAAAESLSDSILSAVEEYRALRRGEDGTAETTEPNRSGTASVTDESVDRLLIRSAGRIRFIATSDIDWLEAAGSYVRIHTGQTTALLRDSITRLARKLPANSFVRIHRSTIVNVGRVIELRQRSHRDMIVVLRDGTELKLSRTFRDKAAPRLGLPG